MSDTSEMRPPRARSKPFEIYVATSAVAFLASYVATYVYSFYLQKMTFDSQFHPGADFPGSLVDPAVHDPNKYNVGVHFFGDFWTTLLRSMEPSPYLVRPGVGGSSYPPFAQFIYEPLTWIPYPFALTIFLVGTTTLIVIPFWRALSAYEPQVRAIFIVIGVLLTYPVLFSLDRGNNIGLTVGFLLFGVLNLYEDRPQRAAIYFAIAAALKIYPVFFLLIFVSRRQWKAFGNAILTGLCITVIPLMTYSGGFINNLKALYDNSGYFRESGGQIALNHSLHAWLLAFRSSGTCCDHPLIDLAINNYKFISLFGIIFLSLALISKNWQTLKPLIFATTLNVLFVPITYGYTHAVWLVVILGLLLIENVEQSDYLTAFLIGVLLASKGIPAGPPATGLFNYLNVPLELAIIFVPCIGWLLNFLKNQSKPTF